MPIFGNWVDANELQTDPDRILVLRELREQRDACLAGICERVLENLLGDGLLEAIEAMGYADTAEVLRGQLPATKRARSADLGEIFVTEYIEEQTSFSVPIKRLRFKDHTEMALRGSDVLAFRTNDPEEGELAVMKAEAKSRQHLTKSTVEQAIDDLNQYAGRPSAKSLGFVVARLAELERRDEWELIIPALTDGISDQNLQHLVFTFSGNDPSEALRGHPPVGIARELTGLHVDDHPEFLREVYEGVYDAL